MFIVEGLGLLILGIVLLGLALSIATKPERAGAGSILTSEVAALAITVLLAVGTTMFVSGVLDTGISLAGAEILIGIAVALFVAWRGYRMMRQSRTDLAHG